MVDINSELEELKKSFIIAKGEYENEKLPLFIKRVLKYAKVNSEGGIYIDSSLTMRDKILISFVARFLANKLQSSIRSEISGEELSTLLDEDKAVVNARLKDLTDIKMIVRLDRGTYEIVPYYIETILNELDNKYTEKESDKQTKPIVLENKKKIAKKVTEIVVSDDFLDKIMNIDKANYTYITNLPTYGLKILGVLYMAEKELKLQWLSSPDILKILSEKFRTKALWSTISVSLKELDQKAFVQSRSKKGHPTAREYRIMQQGQDYLEKEIEKLQNKTT